MDALSFRVALEDRRCPKSSPSEGAGWHMENTERGHMTPGREGEREGKTGALSLGGHAKDVIPCQSNGKNLKGFRRQDFLK